VKQDGNFGRFTHLAPSNPKVPHWTTVSPREKRIVRMLIFNAWSQPLVHVLGHSDCPALIILCRTGQELNRPVFQINLSCLPTKQFTFAESEVEGNGEEAAKLNVLRMVFRLDALEARNPQVGPRGFSGKNIGADNRNDRDRIRAIFWGGFT